MRILLLLQGCFGIQKNIKRISQIAHLPCYYGIWSEVRAVKCVQTELHILLIDRYPVLSITINPAFHAHAPAHQHRHSEESTTA